MVLLTSASVRFFFPAWSAIYRKFYVFLLIAEVLYLVHRLTYLVLPPILAIDSSLISKMLTTDPALAQFSIIGETLFLLNICSEVFVLVCSAYAIHDTISLMATRTLEASAPGTFEERGRMSNWPKVSLHVPVCKEPPDMVIETLLALARIDYSNYEVVVVSNNTKDPKSLWHPVESVCRQLGFKFFHVDTLPGYKAGALNYALMKSSEDVEMIGIVDSDVCRSTQFLEKRGSPVPRLCSCLCANIPRLPRLERLSLSEDVLSGLSIFL